MSYNQQHKKVTLTGFAGVALALLSLNAETAKAAKLPNNELRKTNEIKSKDVAKTAELQNVANDVSLKEIAQTDESPRTNTTDSTAKAELNHDGSNESPAAATGNLNEDQNSQTPNPPVAGENKTSKIEKRSITNISWNNLQLSYDSNSQTLMIPGSSTPINDPEALVDVLNDRIVTKIIIENPLKITGSADRLFGNLGDLKSIEGLEKLDTSEVTSMAGMFEFCSSLETLNLSNFKTANVENMLAMFSDCYRLKKINLSSFNTANVENMEQMFYECRDLEELDLSSFNTAKVTDMGDMFHFCTSLKKLNVSSFNTAKVESMFSMFTECHNLKELDLKNFETTSDPDMDEMFKRCYRLEKVDISGFSFENPDTSLGDLFFQFCFSLNTLVLGPGMPNLENGHIHDDPADPLYNAKWINTGTNPSLPRGTHIWTSEEFVENYQGSQDYDTYIILAQPVTVHYQDTAGKKLAPDKIIDNYGINEELTIQPINLSNYLINSIKVNGGQISSISGAKIKFGKTAQEATFIYQENQPEKPQPAKTATVIVHYQDEEGDTIAPETVLTGKVGEGYITEAQMITGYTLKERPANATGIFSSQTQIVTYVYTKDGTKTEEPGQVSEKEPQNNKQQNQEKSKMPSQLTAKKRKEKHSKPIQKTETKKPQQAGEKNRLPQTGKSKYTNLGLLFLGILTILVSLLGGKHKKKE